MSANPQPVSVNALGESRAEAIDRITRAFHRRGWRDDDDAAGAIVSALSTRGGSASRRVVVSAVPRDFLERNGVQRDAVGRELDRLIAS